MKQAFSLIVLLLLVTTPGYPQNVGKILNKVKSIANRNTSTPAGDVQETKTGNSGQAAVSSKMESSGINSNKESSDNNGKKDSPEASSNPGNQSSVPVTSDTIYSGDPACKSTILYDESRLGISANNNTYTLVVKKECGDKKSFVVIENGKETGSYNNLSDIPVPGGVMVKAGESKIAGVKEPDYTKVSGVNKTVSVNGKAYGPYADVKDVFVTPDKKIVFFEWMEMYGNSGIVFNEKKIDLTPIDDMEAYIDRHLIKSHDKNNLIYLCLSTPASDDQVTVPAIQVKADGIKKKVVINNIDAFGPRVFTVSSKNELCWLDTKTWDLYTEGKKIGTFKKDDNIHPASIALIAGDDLNKAVLYDSRGTLYFLNGNVAKAEAVYPFLSTPDGKTTISWLAQSGENIMKRSIELQ
jgi:hypothetical protein